MAPNDPISGRPILDPTSRAEAENRVVVDTMERLLRPELQYVNLTTPAQVAVGDGIPLAILPSGQQLHSLKRFMDEFRDRPEFRAGTARMHDIDSFVAHVNRFRDPNSALFADPGQRPEKDKTPSPPSLTAVLDYHDSIEDAGDVTLAHPRWGRHRTAYRPPFSDEWIAWRGAEGRKMTQAEFAEFLEERAADLVPAPTLGDPAADGPEEVKLREAAGLLGIGSFPSPNALMILARGLSIHEDTKVRNAQDLATGETRLQFETEHTDADGAPLMVPRAFLILIPVLKHGPLYRIAVKLRYRLRGPAIIWYVELWQADKAFDHAFAELCDRARQGTGLPLFVGAPEAGDR